MSDGEGKIGYQGALNHLRYLGALNRCRLSVSADSRAVTLSLANGGPGGRKAFAAFVQFRDDGGDLILPPYPGFSQSARGAAYFYVAGGEAALPVATTHSFTPPPGAATLQIELRPWAFRERPRLAVEPHVIGKGGTAGAPALRDGVHLLALSGRAGVARLSLANGHEGGTKAFVAAVRFLSEGGSPILPPYEGFAESDRFPAYFYVKGGKADAPSTITYPFAAPSGAAAMEIELHPWHAKEKPRLAAAPALVSDAPGEPRRRAAGKPPRAQPQGNGSDALAAHFAAPPLGSQIVERVDGGRIRIVGIVGDDLRCKLGRQLADAALPFDGYDRDWDRTEPSHLVIDVARLQGAFGWENALTLRDPAATVEMAIMLEKARSAGIRTVLVEPEEPHRYPLLSRIAHLFDMMLKPGEATGERLASSLSRDVTMG